MKKILNYNEVVDVIIAGAGPAGLSAGLELSRKGIKVFIFEKKKTVGKPLKCGELTREEIFKLLDIKNYEKFVRRKYFVSQPANIVISRFKFENYLAQEIEKNGGKIFINSFVEDVKRENNILILKIMHDKEEYFISAKILIIAEGIDSYLARKAGFDTFIRPKDFASCYGAIMKNVDIPDPNRIYIIRDKRIYPGYLWVFPNSENSGNIGLGLLGINGKRAKFLFKKLTSEIKWLKKGEIVEEIVGCISVALPEQKPYKDNILLIGGSAKLVDSISGEGIYQAIYSGKMAAETALIALSQKDCSENILKTYREKIDFLYPELIKSYLMKEKLIKGR